MTDRPLISAELAEGIRRVADRAASEMELQIEIEKLLDPHLPKIPGVTLDRYGHATKLGGIKDALHGNVIIEYERPGKLAKRAGLEECLGQLREYLAQEAQRHGHQATAALRRMVGIGLDGHQILFVRYRGRKPAAPVATKKSRPQMSFFPQAALGDFYVDGPRPVTAESIETFLGYLHSLARLPLTPEALADTFGPRGEIAQHVVGTLYAKLHKTDNRRVQTFFAEWQRIFGIVYGQDIGKAEADARALGKQFGVKTPPKLKEFLFCVHTYFALLMKLLAAEVMTLQRGAMMQSFIAPLGSANSEDFRKTLKDLEDGALFARQGINNFLEGDFFSWYLSVWDKSVAGELRALLRALARFDPRTPYLAPEQSRDLLKKLYQYLVPKKLRHDLGEFYTPDWLAEHLLNQLEYSGDFDKRLLDPACGSGTFLVLAIRRMKEWALEHDPPIEPEHAAKKILDSLCGFDLNPIAVIAARTNFLLAMGELVRYVRPIEIPIYLCDSVLTPSEYAELFGKGYRIPTAAGEFEIPGEIVQSNQMEKLAGLLEQCARGDYTTREFLNRAKRELILTHQATFDALERLYISIHKLEKQNRNGIWARWLKNAFAPLFKGKFDFIAGNPPWINWESLSDEYRKATSRLWQKYGLVTGSGQLERMRGGKKDFAMLFTYACCDSYLLNDGKLGFVITQTVFKSRGAGEGFRRFQIGTGLPLLVGPVDDLSELNPFEDAANRTATLVLKKNRKTSYPVRYELWRRDNGEPSQDATLGDALARVQRRSLSAVPVKESDPTSPWLTLPAPDISVFRRVIGDSAYTAREGANTGGLNGVYWLEVPGRNPDGLIVVQNLGHVGKKKVGAVTAAIEPDLVFPLLRGRDVNRWHAEPSAFILAPQDPQKKREGIPETVLKVELPHTFAYLRGFYKELSSRRDLRYYPKGSAFYTMRNVADYTFAPWKVVWREVSDRFEAGVVSSFQGNLPNPRVAIPDHTLIFVPCWAENEAHFVCALLNSPIAAVIVKGYVALHPSPHVLEHIAVPQFDAQNSTHKGLATCSQRAHDLAGRIAVNCNDEEAKRQLAQVEDEVDRAAAQLWGLTDAELDEIRKALELLS